METEIETSQYSEQSLIRREKLRALKEAGKNPFAEVKFNQSHHSREIKEAFENFEGWEVSLAGRIMAFRDIGKAAFLDLQDQDGRIQLYVSAANLGEDAYGYVKAYDIGDIIGVTGKVGKTRRGEISVYASAVTLLAKSLEPLPEKFHGLKDIEIRYRRRCLDLIMNPSSFQTFKTRAKIISALREYLDGLGYIEVETPTLSPIASGAAARPFVTRSKALSMDLYLRIASELYLKRCIVGGLEKVYDLGKNFRNEGIDIRHNPEFTMIELYQAYADYRDMMSLCENMISRIALKVTGSMRVRYQNSDIDFTPPWRRLTMEEAVREYGGPDFSAVKTAVDAQKLAAASGLEDSLKKKPGDCSRGDILNAAFEKFAEEKLIQPAFILDYPAEISPLTKEKPGDPSLTERFEAFVYGREIANAYSELNDPLVQEERFRQQARERDLGDDEAYARDGDFIASLETGMPPTGGMGIGIDRVVMFLTNAPSIRDVILFPTMKGA
jgi:lysyl-tRNA synthetase class 2